MFKLQLGAILVITFFLSGSKCWVFNDVDIEELARKSFDIDIEYDLENEIDEEYFPSQRFSLIFPGTKWCGAGSIAENYDDLGPARKADICCRAHDHCPDSIPAGETQYNLTNEAIYSRLSCDCDETFRLCLRNARTKVSNVIGKIYFDALGTECFRKDYPTTGCVKRGGWIDNKCVKHSYNTSAPKKYQWFDVEDYKS